MFKKYEMIIPFFLAGEGSFVFTGEDSLSTSAPSLLEVSVGSSEEEEDDSAGGESSEIFG